MLSWSQLPPLVQQHTAEQVARRRRRELRQLPNVISVGWGYRERDGQLTDECAVVVTVQKKWRDRRQRSTSIPTTLAGYAQIGAERRLTEVPVDVYPMADAEAQATASGATLATTQAFGNDIGGTACCQVVDQHGTPYLLGCSHTFALTKVRDFIPSNQYATVETRTALDNGHSIAGALVKDALWRTRYLDQPVDAAIVSTDSAHLAGGRLYDVAMLDNEGADPLLTRYYYAYSGEQAVEQRFERKTSVRVYLHNSATRIPYTFKEVYMFRATDANHSTGWGFSGAPVVDHHGYLVGMHFAGHGDVAYALKISTVLAKFSPLQLSAVYLP